MIQVSLGILAVLGAVITFVIIYAAIASLIDHFRKPQKMFSSEYVEQIQREKDNLGTFLHKLGFKPEQIETLDDETMLKKVDLLSLDISTRVPRNEESNQLLSNLMWKTMIEVNKTSTDVTENRDSGMEVHSDVPEKNTSKLSEFNIKVKPSTTIH